MEVILAKSRGFCFGVKRAVDTVYGQIGKTGKLYTYGDIVNNEEVVGDLKMKDVSVINDMEELKQAEKGTVIIRAHGVGKAVYEAIEKEGFTLMDATCPFVKRIHKIVEEESKKGTQIVVIGNPAHPEVVGIAGWCHSPAIILETIEEAEKIALKGAQNVCIVSQTTFNYNKFQDIVEIISKKRYDIVVLNTICNATKERQTEARQIAARVDAMVVIGDKRSSNTQKLFEICKEECLNTYYIQTLDDLDINQLRSVESVGITAGASTPNNIIEEVQNNVRINF